MKNLRVHHIQLVCKIAKKRITFCPFRNNITLQKLTRHMKNLRVHHILREVLQKELRIRHQQGRRIHLQRVLRIRHRQVLRIHLRQGRRMKNLRVHHILREVLQKELHIRHQQEHHIPLRRVLRIHHRRHSHIHLHNRILWEKHILLQLYLNTSNTDVLMNKCPDTVIR